MCVATEGGIGDEEIALWLLTADHRWEQRWRLLGPCVCDTNRLLGVWDFGGVLLTRLENNFCCLYDLRGTEEDGAAARLPVVVSWGINAEAAPRRPKLLGLPADAHKSGDHLRPGHVQ